MVSAFAFVAITASSTVIVATIVIGSFIAVGVLQAPTATELGRMRWQGSLTRSDFKNLIRLRMEVMHLNYSMVE